MIDKIAGIRIKGRCFTSSTDLLLFPKKTTRTSIVYGNNGSGKSTISKAFSILKNLDADSEFSAQLIANDSSPINLSNTTDSIMVFNENYIDNNVKIDAEGLDSIVLIGEQVDLTDKIRGLESTLEKINSNHEKAINTLKLYKNDSNILSPNYYYKCIVDELKSDDGWAYRDAKIKSGLLESNKAMKIRKSNVTSSIIEAIFSQSTTENIKSLRDKYEKTRRLLSQITDNANDYPTPIKQIKDATNLETKIKLLLEHKIEKPELTEREKCILKLVQEGNQVQVENAKATFSKSSINICPFCFQAVSDEYKADLLTSITHILNKETDLHKKDLQSLNFTPYNVEYEAFTGLDENLVAEIKAAQEDCNNALENYENVVKKKLINIYTPISYVSENLSNNVSILNNLLNQLELKRIKFNESKMQSKKLKDELIKLNSLIACVKLKETYNKYQEQLQEQERKKEIVDNLKSSLDNCLYNLDVLKAKKADIHLALSKINQLLAYIFFDGNRLSIELKDGKYYLQSNGLSVKPKDVSIGERNAIALCYFFTQILENQDISKLYSKSQLVVIDDPVSSFDFNNKVGILSFLRYNLEKILSENDNSKILILSHDLATVYDLQKTVSDYCKYSKSSKKPNYIFFRLVDFNIVEMLSSHNKYNEYRALMTSIYNFAMNPNAESEISIGNAMRRVFEVYSTFTYGHDFMHISRSPEIIDILGEKSEYFRYLMYRLVLNNESHFEEQVYNLHDNTNFFGFISLPEKQRTAKDILCFIFLLNPQHIMSYLETGAGDVQAWCNAIPNNSTFELTEQKSQITNETTTIPLYTMPASAGEGIDISQDNNTFDDYLTAEKNCDFALKLSGDSMSPDYPDGSIILVKKQETINSGEIGAFYYNGEVYCKRYNINGTIAVLESINPSYSPITVGDDDILRLYGLVVGVEKKT